jgi:fucose permease
LRYLGCKNGVLYGLCGLLCYVTSFFLAFIFPSVAYEVFIIGACIGGLGAGILWTSQGEYYSINAVSTIN